MKSKQTSAFTPDLFETHKPGPVGFAQRSDLISADHERDLLAEFAKLPFKSFQFHGFEGKRRVISYGWTYDFTGGVLRQAEPIPSFLLSVREAAAKFAGLAPSDLRHALLLEYPPGSGIGWHKDKPHFGDVIGISLLSPCTLRFRRAVGKSWQRTSVLAKPRSAYLLRGPARTEWEHSILAVEHQRYSITFRTLAQAEQQPSDL
jgi:alkylated DNA repair dioxygenase AlkB